MEKYQSNPIFILNLLVSFLTIALGEVLLSCLTHTGVRNFTTLSSSPPTYNHFLQHTLQNPRFESPAFLKPFSIILPENKHQLADTIVCARKASLAIRIRSGGHSYEGLSSVADTPFVIIDLMNLNRISVDLDSQTVWVESGVLIGEIYHAVGELSSSFAVAAGWCPTVGSGGHFSGGGSGTLTRKYGLAADNVVDAILVDADGRILDREGMGEDVFWAIRGGGGGVFGAIYSWKIQLVLVPEIVTAISFNKTVHLPDAAKLLHRFQYVAPELVEDFSVTILAGARPDGEIWVQFYGLYLGPKSAAISSGSIVFSELDVAVEECKEMSWMEAVAYMLGFEKAVQLKSRTQPHKLGFRSKSDFVRATMPLEVFADVLERLQKEPHAFIALNGQGAAMARIRSDAIPFPHREGNLFAFEYVITWDMEEDSQSHVFVKWLRELYNYMTPFVSKNPRAAYVNHVDLDLGSIDWRVNNGDAVEISRSWGEKYFLGNYDRLVLAKTIIDPNNVFRHPQSIPPLPSICATTVSDGGDPTVTGGLLNLW
ncbi:reticuline oxidase-like [Magnolia sinica]|uniref:reticuline oxidase-like n=1 Tax=Magnolia sinica TaxID=86752 RepID=UPI0026587BCC|nr:reticuline oxidase-like [Magnolia sinica]